MDKQKIDGEARKITYLGDAEVGEDDAARARPNLVAHTKRTVDVDWEGLDLVAVGAAHGHVWWRLRFAFQTRGTANISPSQVERHSYDRVEH